MFWRHFACYVGGGAFLALSLVPFFAPMAVGLVAIGGALVGAAGTPLLGGKNGS